jgi:hypothetical protein
LRCGRSWSRTDYEQKRQGRHSAHAAVWVLGRVPPGQAPVEITSGEVIRVEDPGKEGLHRTRMERDAQGYYSVHGYYPHDGLRAAIGSGK